MAECLKCGNIPKEIFYYTEEITRRETDKPQEQCFEKGKITFRKQLICENCAMNIIHRLELENKGRKDESGKT